MTHLILCKSDANAELPFKRKANGRAVPITTEFERRVSPKKVRRLPCSSPIRAQSVPPDTRKRISSSGPV